MTQSVENREILVKELSEMELKHVEQIIHDHTSNEGNTITLLQKIQNTFGFIPRHVLFYISEKLNIPIADLFGVATFYAQFTFNPKGKYVISLCDGTACHVKGTPLLLEFVNNELKISNGETTEDDLFTLDVVACLGCCALAPVCFINDTVYGHLTPAKLNKIIKKIKKQETKEEK